MLFSAPAKLTLTFEILGKREDGYHGIRSEGATLQSKTKIKEVLNEREN